MPAILFIEFCNYDTFPTGGQLTFAKNMIKVMGEELSLVGTSDDPSDQEGVWSNKMIHEKRFHFFNLGTIDPQVNRTIPIRLISYYRLMKYRKRIFTESFNYVFIQAPEVLMAIRPVTKARICFRFAGVENPLENSRFWYGKYFSKIFETTLFRNLAKVEHILASADQHSIDAMKQRMAKLNIHPTIVQFPTRIDTSIFTPRPENESRSILGFDSSITLIITVGRLAAIKNWKFMIDSFILYRQTRPQSQFLMIGEGEDRTKIEQYLKEKALEKDVILLGKQSPENVAQYLNLADLFVMASLKEGWPTSLIEASACGIPACVTDFSGASEIIENNITGIVNDHYDVEQFTNSMLKANTITRFNPSKEFIDRYSINSLKRDFLEIMNGAN